MIDTGADVSGFAPRLFTALELKPIDQIALYTPSTPPNCPHLADVFDVSLSVVAGGAVLDANLQCLRRRRVDARRRH